MFTLHQAHAGVLDRCQKKKKSSTDKATRTKIQQTGEGTSCTMVSIDEEMYYHPNYGKN